MLWPAVRFYTSFELRVRTFFFVTVSCRAAAAGNHYIHAATSKHSSIHAANRPHDASVHPKIFGIKFLLGSSAFRRSARIFYGYNLRRGRCRRNVVLRWESGQWGLHFDNDKETGGVLSIQ